MTKHSIATNSASDPSGNAQTHQPRKGKGGYKGGGKNVRRDTGGGKDPNHYRRDKRRHDKANAWEHITENDMIRLARRAGISRIAQCIYPITRRQMTAFTEKIVKDALAYVESSLDDQHKAEEFDAEGNFITDAERNVVLKRVAPEYGGTISLRAVMAALERNNFKMYWHGGHKKKKKNARDERDNE